MGSMWTASQRTLGTILHVWMKRKEVNAFSFIIFIDKIRQNKFIDCVLWHIWSYGFWDLKMGSNWKAPKPSQINIWIFDISIWCNPVNHRKPYNFPHWKRDSFVCWCVMNSIEALQENTCAAAVCSFNLPSDSLQTKLHNFHY